MEDAVFVTDANRPTIKSHCVARWLVGFAMFALALLLGLNSSAAVVTNIWRIDYGRPVVGLIWIWAHSAPLGMLIGIVLGCALLPTRHLMHIAVRFLRVARWIPFLIWFPTVAMFGGRNFTTLWVWIWAAMTVALTACYELLIARTTLNLPFKSSLRTVFHAAALQGLFISLVLGMSLWIDLWSEPLSGSPLIGTKVFMILAATILLINWSSGINFRDEAIRRGITVINELKNESWKSFAGAITVIFVCLLSWEFANGFRYSNSPRELFFLAQQLLYEPEFRRDIAITCGEIVAGIVVSGFVTVVLLSDMDRLPRLLRCSVDSLLQAFQVALIALLPDVFFSFESEYAWSCACAAIFCFHPFARVFYGTRSETALRRILLAVDEALPYGAAGIVYGQMMRATSGLVFFVAVASATHQTSKAIVGFITLVLLVALLSTLLRWFAKRGLFASRMIGPADWAPTDSIKTTID